MTAVSSYTEDIFIPRTTTDHLEQQLGWESVYVYNSEASGPDSLLSRESDREVDLTHTLRAKIEELNTDLPSTAYEDAARYLEQENSIRLKLLDLFLSNTVNGEILRP